MSEEAKAHGNTSALTTIEANALDRDMRALNMRIDGATYAEIDRAEKYGGEANARRAVLRRMKAKRESVAEKADEVRELELLRLDIALAAIIGKIRNGDYQAIDRLLRIQDRRAAYLGLDQPKGLKVEMARELEGFLGKLRENFDDDVYERILALLAGEYGGEASSPISDGEGEEASSGGSEGGEGSPSPAP